MKKLIALLAAVTLLLCSVSVSMADTVIDTILSAGTTQDFSDEPVSEEDLNTIMQAGLSATSAINQQPWFFVAVTDADTMDKLSGSGAMPAGKPEGMPAGAPAGMPEGAPAGAPAGMPAMAASSGPKAALGDSPAAIIIYMNPNSMSPDASFDCGLATQNMYIAAAALGYGVKIVSSPTMTLNGADHDALCEMLGVDPAMQALAVMLLGKPAETDAVSSASVRATLEEKTNTIR